MKYLFPITAINRDGRTRLLYSVRDVLDFAREHRWVGREWIRDQEPLWAWNRDPIENDWILRDDAGHPVDHRGWIPGRPNWKNRKHNHTYRRGPVEGITHCSGGWKCDAPRKRHGGRGVLVRAEMHRREFHELMGRPRIRRHFYCD